MSLDAVKSVGTGYFYCPDQDIISDIQTKKVDIEINKCNSLTGTCQSSSYIESFFQKRVFTTGVFQRKAVVKNNEIYMAPDVIITN